MLRRTTVVAEDADLDVLAHEARHRGLSLGRMLGVLVAEKAQELRENRRPLFATFHADVSIADAMEREEPAAHSFRG